MEAGKKDRLLEIFFRLMKGEDLSAQKLAAEYDVSSRSISRDITSLKTFFDLNFDKLGKPELVYNNLSQGSWVRALEPESFVEDMKSEIKKMYDEYF